MNYFNYFTEIEDTFVRRRGKHLLLSPMDWALIESWKEMNVPLHVALRGIEKAFDSWEAKPRRRTVKTLLYCQEEVEAQYAEWLESRAGATVDGDSSSKNKEDEGLPFARQAILEHLRRARSALAQAFETRQERQDDFADALSRAANLLEELERDFAEAADPDAQKLELSLTGLERMLSDTVRATVSVDLLETARSEVKEQLRPYRKHMEKSIYEQTAENLLLKRLREQFAIPRLSLFYL
ncbi:MAG TPA: hypothetical protein VJM12_05730 [Pyrinomonadaceae bacterium]|nr:hypothetical protein [Pyrinomonadaceae bacterium]